MVLSLKAAVSIIRKYIKRNNKMKIVLRVIASLVIFFIIFYLSPLFFSSFVSIRAIPGNTPKILSEFTYFIISSLFILILSKGKISEYGFRNSRVNYILSSIIITFLICSLLWFIPHLISNDNNGYHQISNDLALFNKVFILILLPSIAEETFVRGLIQSYLMPLRNFGFSLFKKHISLPVLLSTLFFGALHIWIFYYELSVIYSIGFIVKTLIIGFIAAYYREKSNSLITPILIHITANSVVVFFPLLFN